MHTRHKTVVSKNANALKNRLFSLRNKVKDGFFFYLNLLFEQNKSQLIVFSVKRKNSSGQVGGSGAWAIEHNAFLCNLFLVFLQNHFKYLLFKSTC
jgi:hypothetical protein